MNTSLPTEDDPYLWLEEVSAEQCLEWVGARNAETIERLTHTDRFHQLRSEINEVLDADERIPHVRRRGEYLYNFWRDAAHPRGLWRRTTLDEYRKPDPEWELLLDVDSLAAREGENWVWQGATILRPENRRCLIELSRGGADATVVREFDIQQRDFVEGGFELPEAKSSVSWIDENRIYVGTDFGPGSMTTSGYPRLVKEWHRGTPLDQALDVFEGKHEDIGVRGFRDLTKGWERDFIRRARDFYHSELYLRASDRMIRIDVPDDAAASIHREWLLVRTRTPWSVDGNDYPAGALLAARLDSFLAGDHTMTVLFRPNAHTCLDYYVWTRNHLIIGVLRDVRTELRILTPSADGWDEAELTGVPELDATKIVDTEPDRDDEFLFETTGFTQPPTLMRGELNHASETRADKAPETLKQAPAFFRAAGLSTEQRFALSRDGTRIPYFIVGPHNHTPGPTLLTGYGGFEVSLTPSYNAVIGTGWLARGGTYVVANLRGGGEYGPQWHNQAIKENRLRVYEDFAAVAAALIEQGITTPEQLGVQGGSNGGLLTGVMLTRYPELFGAIVSQVPLLDMRRYHLLLAGASWMAEYGDPDNGEDWSYIGEYSPYQNLLGGQNYPPTLFVTSTRDDRVHPGHARKMVAKMREHQYPVEYYENIEGGHGAAADNAQIAFKWALVLEFLWRHLAEKT